MSAPLALVLGCAASDEDTPGLESGDASAASQSSQDGGGPSGSAGTGQDDDDDDDDGADDGMQGPPGGPGCGFSSAAFCETFDAPSDVRGRAGELDPTRWSVGRLQPQLPTGGGFAFPIGPATLGPCRADLPMPTRVFPDDDAVVCDANDDIQSPHLLAAVGAQNYGITSFRVRRPFDFTDRTGTIVFDGEGYNIQLLGWISVEVTEDPIAVPSYGFYDNDEGGVLPRNGFEVQFSYACNSVPPDVVFSPSAVHVFRDYADEIIPTDYQSPTPAPCVSAGEARLNHFEIEVSTSHIEVRVSPASADGLTFEPAQVMASLDVDLPFSRGYVHISAHNHATKKYSGKGACSSDSECTQFGPNYVCEGMCVMDSWLARFDNVGFDGPVIEGWREVEVPDALRPGDGADVMNIAYTVADAADGPSDVLVLPDVDTRGVTSAQLALTAWYLREGAPLEDYLLQYRFNGGPWRDRPLTPEEITALTAPVIGVDGVGGSQGAVGQMLDVDPGDLVDGDNTLEFVTVNVPQNYPPAVLNLDLVLHTE